MELDCIRTLVLDVWFCSSDFLLVCGLDGLIKLYIDVTVNVAVVHKCAVLSSVLQF